MKTSFWKKAVPRSLCPKLPKSDDTILDLLTRACKESPRLPAFTMEDHSITFAELNTYSERLAQYFLSLPEIEKGDRILLQLPNIIAFPIVVFAGIKAGLIIVSCNPLYKRGEILRIVNDCKPKIAVGLSYKLSIYQNMGIPLILSSMVIDTAPGWRCLKTLLYCKWMEKKNNPMGPPSVKLRTILKSKGWNTLRTQDHHPDDTVLLQYTGGSTGVFKGAQLSHRNIVSNVRQLSAYLGDHVKKNQEIAITILPMYHIFSFTVHCMMGVFTSTHVILIPDPSNIGQVIKQIAKWPFTTLSGINTLFSSLLKNSDFRKLDFSTLKLSISGGMRLDPELAKRWFEITKCPIIEGFGMSETSPVISLNHPDHNKLETVGFPLPETEVKIVRDDGQESVRFEEEGEIYVRGPQVSRGYWQKSEENKLHYTADCWLKTGDIGKFLPSGHLQITGRKKELIIVSGFNVYPSEVREVLLQYPHIKRADVYGVAHKVSGEMVHARILVEEGQAIQAAELRNFCRNHLVSYKVPRKIEFIQEGS